MAPSWFPFEVPPRWLGFLSFVAALNALRLHPVTRLWIETGTTVLLTGALKALLALLYWAAVPWFKVIRRLARIQGAAGLDSSGWHTTPSEHRTDGFFERL